MSKAFGSAKNWDTPVEEKPGGGLAMGQDGLLTRTRVINVRTARPEDHIVWHEAHPENDKFLLTGANAQEIGPDLWKLHLTYSGPPVLDVETIRYNSDTQSSPIEVHPHMDELKAFAKTDDDEAFVEWDPPLSDPVHLTGIDSYLDPRMTFERTLVRHNTAGWLAGNGADFFNLAEIFASPPNNVVSISGRDWLLIQAGIEVIGGALRIQQNFQLSGPNGWNPYIYDENNA